MTKKFEPILVLENEIDANRRIKEEQSNADSINEKLKYFNSLTYLKSLSSFKEIEQIITNPKAALDKNILESLKDSFESKIQPNPEQLAKLFDIPYDKILGELKSIGPVFIRYLDYKDGLLHVSEESKEKIREVNRVYAECEEEVNALQVQKRLADALNEYYEKFTGGLDNMKTRAVAEKYNLGLEFNGYKLMFRDNIKHIKSRFREGQYNDQGEQNKMKFKSK